MSIILVKCACGHKLGVPEEYEGRRVKCPACGIISPVKAEVPGDGGDLPAIATEPFSITDGPARKGSTPALTPPPIPPATPAVASEPWFYAWLVGLATTCLMLVVAQFLCMALFTLVTFAGQFIRQTGDVQEAGGAFLIFGISAALLFAGAFLCLPALVLVDVARNVRRSQFHL